MNLVWEIAAWVGCIAVGVIGVWLANYGDRRLDEALEILGQAKDLNDEARAHHEKFLAARDKFYVQLESIRDGSYFRTPGRVIAVDDEVPS